jgi:hypothetical protein
MRSIEPGISRFRVRSLRSRPGMTMLATVQAIKFVHFFFGRKIAAARVVHSGADSGSLFIGKPVHAAATRFDFASHRHSTFAGSGCSEAALAARAALAVSASAAIFFCPSEPGCTTPQDMIRVAASSALISTSMILLFGT